MPASKSTYRRLGGSGAALSYYARLYLGPDHLLQSASTGYSETYKRFYFRDIQAVIIRKSSTWLFWMLFWLLPAMAFALGALSASGQTAMGLWITTGGLLLGLLANTLLGPTCVCHVRTAVQTEKLPSLKRLPKARKILGQIKPLIEAAQGRLTPDELAARRAGAVAREGGAQILSQSPVSEPPAQAEVITPSVLNDPLSKPAVPPVMQEEGPAPGPAGQTE